MTSTAFPRLILGSTSRYRQELLHRLGLPFDVQAPDVDESPLPGEAPNDLAMRLALAKAQAVAALNTDDVVVIGSDQVADLAGQPLGKPGTHERAVAQLTAMRGQAVIFHTAVAVVRPRTGFSQTLMSATRVQMGHYSDNDIETYLRCEKPYDCAGSAKSEGLGIVLLDRIESDDPTALIGLPLIPTTQMIRQAGLDPLAWRAMHHPQP
ncbi:Maf family nucleotide pyrophosphatase [Aquabacterium sp.]|uniref:Maf family nucleotide pyrophosphatase n=1 Tax=Aquabacterium sp. TaxID=1872578 RepID=UPI0019B6024D|nr:Maf family nucleotide pyrophosphatase [Aquabacterium sp.]MBC7699644.1 septum formation protein Maf [Aquabacterium sp.]